MTDKKMLKQEALLRKALHERGIDCSGLSISGDHLRGRNYLNDLELGIIYPDSFLKKAQSLHRLKKKYTFYFNGNMGKRGQRSRLLEPFQDMKKGKIIKSNFGRVALFKASFNYLYYIGMARAIYGLCPHQLNWPGPREDTWTYRFIECCLVKTMPVLFDETPLGENFIAGFEFVTDGQFMEIQKHEGPEKELDERLEHNFRLAKERFFLSSPDIARLVGYR